jgi:ribonuclease I
MEYRLVRIFPYTVTGEQAVVLEALLSQGWTLHGSPFVARQDEYFQAVVRHRPPLKEPVKGGSLSRG